MTTSNGDETVGAVGGLFEANRRGYCAGFDDDGDGVGDTGRPPMRCGLRQRTAGAVCARLGSSSSEISVWPLPVVEMLLVGGDDLSGRDESR